MNGWMDDLTTYRESDQPMLDVEKVNHLHYSINNNNNSHKQSNHYTTPLHTDTVAFYSPHIRILQQQQQQAIHHVFHSHAHKQHSLFLSPNSLLFSFCSLSIMWSYRCLLQPPPYNLFIIFTGSSHHHFTFSPLPSHLYIYLYISIL